MKLDRTAWGRTAAGEDVALWILEAGDLRARLTDYGARVVALEAPDRAGTRREITLGYEDLAGYEASHGYLGCIVGRWANRIAGASFLLDGREYALVPNEGVNQLHGGPRGFDRCVWRAESVEEEGAVGVAFTLVSPAGDQGFPGTLSCRVVYRLTTAGEIAITYEAECDAPTVVNLTHHGYWNLAGEGVVLDHEVEVCADTFFPANAEKIPTGERLPVADKSLDFRVAKPLRSELSVPDAFLRDAGGLDHCFVVRRSGPGLALAARVREPVCGRTLEMRTTEPALQLYGGAGLPSERGRGGRRHRPAAGLCLEAQRPPDAPNQPQLGPAVLRPGEAYRQETRYRFGVG